MAVAKRIDGRALSIPAGLSLGTISALIVTMAIIAVQCKVILSGILGEKSIGYGIMAALFIASYISAVISCTKIKHRKKLVCIVSGIVFYTSLLAITALFFGGQYSGLIATAFAVAGGSISAVFTCAVPSTPTKKRKYKLPNR